MELTLHKAALLAGVGICGGMLAYAGAERWEARAYVEEATARCEAAEDSRVCLQGIERYNFECHRGALRGGGRYTPAHVDIHEYDYCVRNSPGSVEQWRRAKGEKKRKRIEERKALNADIPGRLP